MASDLNPATVMLTCDEMVLCENRILNTPTPNWPAELVTILGDPEDCVTEKSPFAELVS